MEDEKLDEGETSYKFKERLETHPNLIKRLVFSCDLGGGQPTSAAQACSGRPEDPSERFLLSFCSDGTLMTLKVCRALLCRVANPPSFHSEHPVNALFSTQTCEQFTVAAQSPKSTFAINAALLLPPRCTPPWKCQHQYCDVLCVGLSGNSCRPPPPSPSLPLKLAWPK